MLKVLLVDDERAGLNVLNILLADFKTIQVCGMYTDPLEALEHFDKEDIDGVFLDVEMPKLSGTELARKIKAKNKKTKIIFVTAYEKFAVEAFEINSLDYLLKPITKSRIEKSVNRLIEASGDNCSREITICCFGNFNVFKGKEPFSWKTQKVKEICAYLVHHEGKPVERDKMLEKFWPEAPVDKGKTSLYTGISYLRNKFKEYGYENIILKKGTTYFMDLSQFKCDLLEYLNILKSIEPISSRNVEIYNKLAGLYIGEYMENYEWAGEKREYIHKRMLYIFNQISEFYKTAGKLEKSLEYTEKEMILFPYSDMICQRLMYIHLEMGNPMAALIAYKSFKKVLNNELGLEPSVQTKSIMEKILKGVPYDSFGSGGLKLFK